MYELHYGPNRKEWEYVADADIEGSTFNFYKKINENPKNIEYSVYKRNDFIISGTLGEEIILTEFLKSPILLKTLSKILHLVPIIYFKKIKFSLTENEILLNTWSKLITTPEDNFP